MIQAYGVVIINGEGEEVVELRSRICKRDLGVDAHALTQDVSYLKWQQRWRDY